MHYDEEDRPMPQHNSSVFTALVAGQSFRNAFRRSELGAVVSPSAVLLTLIAVILLPTPGVTGNSSMKGWNSESGLNGTTRAARAIHEKTTAMPSELRAAQNVYAPISALETQSSNAEAAELMARVVTTYRSLLTYSDSGTAIVSLGSTEDKIEFETLFKRPGKLRFSWTIEHDRPKGFSQHGLIWSDGASAWVRYSFHGNKPERKKNLEVAVAGATGASYSTAHTIPRLLSVEVGGVGLDELQALRLLGTDSFDGVDCLMLVGSFRTGTEVKLWIGRRDYLVRRLQQLGKDVKIDEVRRDILVGHEIPDSRFTEQGPQR